jgi:hypothetical protein
MSPTTVNCLSNPSVDGADICEGCHWCAREKLKVRKSPWRAHRINYKCSHGPHTEEFNKVAPGAVVADVVMLDSAADNRKRSADPVPATPDTLSKINYAEKDSNEFKVTTNLCHTGESFASGSSMAEAVALDFTNRQEIGYGRPRKTIEYHTAKLVERRCEELKVLLAQADKERMRLVSSQTSPIERHEATVAVLTSK